jgi:hypothetical protein
MTPKYRGFKGAITAIPDDNGNVQKWSSSGIKRRVTEKAIEIIELPVGTWTEDKTFLEAEVAKMVYSKLWTHTTPRQTSASLSGMLPLKTRPTPWQETRFVSRQNQKLYA